MASKFPITYIQEFQPEAQARVRKRFSKDIGYLKANGFQELCFYSEKTPPLSLRRIGYLIILVMMFFGREVLRVQNERQVAASFMLLAHPERATIALPMGMGIKLYSAFEDGYLLITNSFPVWEQPKPGTNVEKQSSTWRGSDVWSFHLKRLSELEGNGKKLVHLLNFDMYVRMSNQEEQTIG